MNNNLIRTDTVWYKIKSFLSNLFRKKENKIQNIVIQEENTIETEHNKEVFKEEISYKEELKEIERKDEEAQEQLTGRINCVGLTEEELEEMTEYFMEDIKKQEQELQRIKSHIIEMSKKLQNTEV